MGKLERPGTCKYTVYHREVETVEETHIHIHLVRYSASLLTLAYMYTKLSGTGPIDRNLTG